MENLKSYLCNVMNFNVIKYFAKEYSGKAMTLVLIVIVYCIIHYDIESSVFLKIQSVYDYVYSLSLHTYIPEILLAFGLLFLIWNIAKRWNDKYDSILFNVLCGLAIMALLLTKENWRYIYVFGSNYIDVCDCICFLLAIRLIFPFGKWITLYDSTITKLSEPSKKDDVQNIDQSRKLYAKAIVDDLNQRDLSRESFAVGICGEWGTGKTTFLKHIEKNLSEGNNITYSYNVWKSYTPDNIIKDFFSGLANTLSPYYSRLKKPLLKYADALTAIHADSSLSYLVSLIQPDCSTESLRNDIKDSLSKINKRIFVLFDDIDRLSKEELFEVLRLIRNTANFPNIVYLVTYDKNYVTEQIKALNINEQYLNKIFMLELTLPKLVDNPKFSYIYTTILNSVDLNYKNSILNVLINHHNFIEMLFTDIRQCERFSNLFLSDVRFILTMEKADCYFIEDLFWLELLKFYDWQIYLTLQNNPNEILDYATNIVSKTKTYEYPKKGSTTKVSAYTNIILEKLFHNASKFSTNENRMAFLEYYTMYFDYGFSSITLDPKKFDKLINEKCDFDKIHKSVFYIIHERKTISLQNHLLQKSTYNLTVDQAKNYISIIFSLKYWGESNQDIFEDKLYYNTFDKSINLQLSEWAKSIIEKHIADLPHVSAKIYRALLWHFDSDDNNISFIDYTNNELVMGLKQCVNAFLDNNNCDASDITNQYSPLYRMFEICVTSEHEIPGVDESPLEYRNLAFKEFLEYFREHKSKNKEAVINHFRLEDNIPDEFQENDSDRLEDKIRSLFGTHDNYNKYLDECFE